MLLLILFLYTVAHIYVYTYILYTIILSSILAYQQHTKYAFSCADVSLLSSSLSHSHSFTMKATEFVNRFFIARLHAIHVPVLVKTYFPTKLCLPISSLFFFFFFSLHRKRLITRSSSVHRMLLYTSLALENYHCYRAHPIGGELPIFHADEQKNNLKSKKG